MNDLYHYTECGLDYIYLKNGVQVHSTDYGDGVSISDLDALHKAIALDMIANRVHLSGDEFRFLRREMALSQKALGNIFGVTDQAVAKWEKGLSNIPKSNDLMMRKLYQEYVGEKGDLSDIIAILNELEKQLADLQEHKQAVLARTVLQANESKWEVALEA